ncbi:L-threonine 3-dehydrogenase [Oceanococcus atlanticus]|uniref:L-threonine 3-dehydrogenase n=1 Tax=Oceanococcus atlanticus TaxID=1317117 RepID=A0A1Y1SC66_9GAMM|nr:L-threonine 3-dehydrogenase [Oceanococcus atlanticus]ORE85925.1 L-threonine 3-dehydrogenase [Oceanococcus atlanticus]
MHALSKLKPEPGIWQVEVEIPQPGPNDVLIEVAVSAICGTDMHIYNWDDWAQHTIPVPMVVGHEFVGRVAALGSHVDGLQLGQRVSGEGHITCGYCRNCRAGTRHLCRNTIGVGVNRPGSFAQYLMIPAVNVFPIPDAVDDRHAAIFDPLGNAVHTALAFNLVGEDVLITGAGPIGLMAAAVARHVGARHVVITDVNDYRLDLGRQMGADRVVNVSREALPEVMRDLGMREGFDVGLEMSGNAAAMDQMFSVMNHGGRIAQLGIPAAPVALDYEKLVFKGLTLKGIYGREMFETWYKMTAMLESGLNIDPVITHEFSITDFQQGFDAMASGQSGKVLLNWN